jgi:hypothetical protein
MTDPAPWFGLRWSAIWRPALSTSVFLLPLGILQQVLVDRGTIARGGSESLLFFAGYLFLGAVAGFGSARLAESQLLQHGAAAAALAYAIVQGVGIVRHLAIGKSAISPLSFIYLALLMATCGMLGAMLERRAAKVRVAQEELRRRSGHPGGDT